MFVDKHGHGKGGVLENENKQKGVSKNSNFGGKTSMHKSTSMYSYLNFSMYSYMISKKYSLMIVAVGASET